MQSIQKILFFTNQTCKQLKKKWATLLLLFLFPIFLISLLLGIVSGLLIPMENNPIRVVLVDEDDTKESKLFSQLLEETASGNEYLQIVTMPKEDAQALMDTDEISVYFSFPTGFTEDLYEGNSVKIPIVGNPSRQTESLVVKELVESMTRLLATAQASILTINDYAKELDIPKDERKELLFKQFVDFTLYTLGKNKLLNEEVISNIATSSPKHYYALSGWFTLLTIWLLGFYVLASKDEHASMRIRMKLLGVTLWQRTFSRICVSLGGGLLFGAVAFFILSQFVQYELYVTDYVRFSLFTMFYALLFLICIAIIEVVISSPKSVLLLQSLFTVLCIFSSGAIIPVLYFPQSFQIVLPYLFANESIGWMIDIVLEGRNYADYTKLFLISSVGLLVLWLFTVGKERWSR